MAKKEKAEQTSYFTGNTFKFLLLYTAFYLGTIFSLFIAYPWLLCMFQRWEKKNTIINNRSLYFDGKGGELFKKYIKWLLLTIVTLFIYSLWLKRKVLEWRVSHTHFCDSEEKTSVYKYGMKERIIMLVKYYAIIICTLTFGKRWAYCFKLRWTMRHISIDGCKLDFDGKGLQYFGLIALNTLLSIVTVGIYLLWVPVKLERWEAKHTFLAANG